MKPDDKLYGLKDQEQLDATVDEVIKRVIDDHCEHVGETFDTIAGRIGFPVQVCVFRRMRIYKPALVRCVLEASLEMLDEVHGDPDGNPTEETPTMKAAAEAFADVMEREYVPWSCEQTGEVIDVTREHARAMLEDE